MSTYKNPSTPETQETRNWQELYILAKHWKSDLEFYKEDLRFLKTLIEKYLIWITKKDNLELVSSLRKKEHELIVACTSLLDKVSGHLHKASELATASDTGKETEFRNVHLELETALASFVKTFRENRMEVFKVTEYIMDSEELQNILDT
jgi:hypothetical protein